MIPEYQDVDECTSSENHCIEDHGNPTTCDDSPACKDLNNSGSEDSICKNFLNCELIECKTLNCKYRRVSWTLNIDSRIIKVKESVGDWGSPAPQANGCNSFDCETAEVTISGKHLLYQSCRKNISGRGAKRHFARNAPKTAPL